MKKLAALILLTFSLFSCSVKEAILPDLGSRVEGTYNAWYLQQGNVKTNLPNANGSLAISLKRDSRTSVTSTITFVIQGKVTNSTGKLTLEIDNTDNTIELKDGNTYIGFIDGNELTIDGNIDGVKTTIYADKK